MIVRGSVNVNVGAKTKAVDHFAWHPAADLRGVFSGLLEHDSAVGVGGDSAGDGIQTGESGAVRQMWNEGSYQFTPFIITLIVDRAH